MVICFGENSTQSPPLFGAIIPYHTQTLIPCQAHITLGNMYQNYHFHDHQCMISIYVGVTIHSLGRLR